MRIDQPARCATLGVARSAGWGALDSFEFSRKLKTKS
jgi:hypothetical protein